MANRLPLHTVTVNVAGTMTLRRYYHYRKSVASPNPGSHESPVSSTSSSPVERWVSGSRPVITDIFGPHHFSPSSSPSHTKRTRISQNRSSRYLRSKSQNPNIDFYAEFGDHENPIFDFITRTHYANLPRLTISSPRFSEYFQAWTTYELDRRKSD